MGIYQNIHELITQYIYGGAELTNGMEITASLLSTIMAIGVFILPFIVLYYVIIAISRAWK